MTDQLDRARHDLASGRAWKARDRLHGILRDRQDDEVLDLLATVHHGMGDLPAAGALWFVTGLSVTAVIVFVVGVVVSWRWVRS